MQVPHMVIQLTAGELAMLELAAAGHANYRSFARRRSDADLALLLDMQLVVINDGELQITLIGQRILKHARLDPRRSPRG
jgi:hypothetical protein